MYGGMLLLDNPLSLNNVRKMVVFLDTIIYTLLYN